MTDVFGVTGQQPRYLRIAQALAADIADGRYPVGGMLPTEAELCTQFGVSRSTVREALRRLQELGLVSRTQGIGTRVEERHAKSTYIMSAQSAERVMQYAAETELTLIEMEEVVADEALVGIIGGETGRRWVHFGGTRAVPGDPDGPFCFTSAYVAGRFAAVQRMVSRDAPLREPIHQILREAFGVQISEIRQSMQAIAADEADATRLNIPLGAPALKIVRQYLMADGDVMEASVNTYPAGRFEYSMRLKLSPGTG
ncbi:GntR family transcriptional regulator [Acuticoccus mangrovi]|uniref:GntR family transcriptional regulator n=1 Tax=Acuticoccus mangrovi TaxID=2796142 RepID=A0A934IIX7_9HYPH|nr:GntR family transcriptional regulator [Acuticoccus mangrovi]